MRFDDALDHNRIPLHVGTLRLRYESSLLIAEPRPRPRSLLPEALWLGGAVLGVLAAAMLLMPGFGDSAWIAGCVGLVAGGCVLAAISAEKRERARRGFVLNFATETLRIEVPAQGRAPSRLWLVKFDGVRDLQVLPSGSRTFVLQVTFDPSGQATPPPGTDPALPERLVEERLVDGVDASEVETLRKLWRILGNAFGLRRGMSALEP